MASLGLLLKLNDRIVSGAGCVVLLFSSVVLKVLTVLVSVGFVIRCVSVVQLLSLRLKVCRQSVL